LFKISITKPDAFRGEARAARGRRRPQALMAAANPHTTLSIHATRLNGYPALIFAISRTYDLRAAGLLVVPV
jgi:hypothetical protein